MKIIKQLFSRRRIWNDLSAEIQEHLAEKTEELMALGLSRTDAERAARREFGNPMQIEERSREVWQWPSLESVIADVRYGIRQLRRSPGFTVVSLLTLTLGIGANTALFSVVNGVLLSPIPYTDPDQLVTIHESKPNFPAGSISFPNFRDWRKENHTFSAMATTRSSSATLTGSGDAEQVRIQFISSDLFRVLGIKPVIGRDLEAGEDEIGAAPIAIISAGLWKRKFQSSPDVLGKTLVLNAKPFTIVGVVPAISDSINNFQDSPVYLPIGQWTNPILNNRGAGLGFHGFGRLKPGVTIQQARADLELVTKHLADAYPKDDNGVGATVFPLTQDTVGSVRPFLLLLLAAVGFVLLIACVNVANLMLARSVSRAREFAIRSALGAGRTRLVRQLLTESLLLATVGGALGLLLAAWGTQAALKRLAASLPRAQHIGVDTRVLIFTAIVSLLAGVLFGLAPAIKTAQASLREGLNESGRGLSGARHRTQEIFVTVEVALALVLLVGAGLMLRTMIRLWNVDPGFKPDNVMTFGLSLPPSMNDASPDALREAFREADRRFAAIPGIQAVSVTLGAVPLGADDETLFWPDGQPKPANDSDMNWAVSYVVEPDYLKVMGTPLKRGRFFTDHDDSHAARVIVVDEAFAHQYFPNEDPLGKRINLAGGSGVGLAQIVGVVAHVKQWAMDSEEKQLQAEMYIPLGQVPDQTLGGPGVGFVLRSDPGRARVLDSIREATKQMSSEQVVWSPQTMDERIAGKLADRQFSMILLSVFAGLALVLASVGIYGVVSYWVGQRTHEIGVRVALGATRRIVLGSVLGQAVSLAAIGVFVGLVAAFGLTRLMNNLIYGVSAVDPATFALVATSLIAVTVAACYLPARRATRVDPIVALRHE